jgi:hypothetical protein
VWNWCNSQWPSLHVWLEIVKDLRQQDERLDFLTHNDISVTSHLMKIHRRRRQFLLRSSFDCVHVFKINPDCEMKWKEERQSSCSCGIQNLSLAQHPKWISSSCSALSTCSSDEINFWESERLKCEELHHCLWLTLQNPASGLALAFLAKKHLARAQIDEGHRRSCGCCCFKSLAAAHYQVS